MKEWLTPRTSMTARSGAMTRTLMATLRSGVGRRAGAASDLSILAQFTTPGGIQIRGEIGGVDRVFAIGLFAKEQIHRQQELGQACP